MGTDERDAYLEAVLVGGRERVTIEVVDYDPAWPVRFAALAEAVSAALGKRAHSVDHIGSTAVAGLAAKPIIDMALTVDDVVAEDRYVPALEAIGYVLRVREDHHRMLRTPARDVHLHVYAPGRAELADVLALRDWLRVDAADRERYAAVKRALAQREWRDMNEYADAKTEVVLSMLRRARSGS